MSGCIFLIERRSHFSKAKPVGDPNPSQGKKHVTVDAGITTFCNHGCNGTYSYGDENAVDFTEMSVDLNHAPEALLNKASQVYSPVFERRLRQILNVGDSTLRDIRQGEEILCDYLSCEYHTRPAGGRGP